MLEAHNNEAPVGGGGFEDSGLTQVTSTLENTQKPGGSPVGSVPPFQTVGDLTSPMILRLLTRRAAELDQ